MRTVGLSKRFGDRTSTRRRIGGKSRRARECCEISGALGALRSHAHKAEVRYPDGNEQRERDDGQEDNARRAPFVPTHDRATPRSRQRASSTAPD